MGRKKKKALRPWCWYCNREFEDEKILIQHQKAKHFKCHICNKKLFTGPGLAIHCMQVHKETIDKIPGSVPGRDNVNIEIFGMEGVPMDAEIGTVSTDEPPMKQAKIMAPQVPGMPPGFPPGFPGLPGMPPFMPPFMPPVPGMPGVPRLSGPGVLPGMPPIPGAVPQPPLPPNPSVHGGVPAAFPAYQQAMIKAEQPEPPKSHPFPPPFPESSGAPISSITIKPITARTRIVCPDESVSLEEVKYQAIQRGVNLYGPGPSTVSSAGMGVRGAVPAGISGGFFR